jgi:regulatory protein
MGGFLLDDNTVIQKEPSMPQPSIRQSALNLLARREHSAAELTRKLQAKGYESIDIQSLIIALEQEGLLNHQRFIENYIHYRRNKGYGPLHIQAQLIERGIHQELIEQELNIADNAWFTEAFRAWQKRFKNKAPTDYKSRAQQMRFLQYKGFTREQIESVFESIK